MALLIFLSWPSPPPPPTYILLSVLLTSRPRTHIDGHYPAEDNGVPETQELAVGANKRNSWGNPSTLVLPWHWLPSFSHVGYALLVVALIYFLHMYGATEHLSFLSSFLESPDAGHSSTSSALY